MRDAGSSLKLVYDSVMYQIQQSKMMGGGRGVIYDLFVKQAFCLLKLPCSGQISVLGVWMGF